MSVLRSRCLALIVASAALTGVPRPSAAATFAVDDHAQLGTKIVRLEGDIVQGDEDRLRKVLISLKGTVLTEVFVALDSPGGKGREGLKLRVTNASTTWVRVVTSPWQKQISGLGPPREILLDLDAVGLTLRLPPDSVDALWTAVLERHPSESL